MWRSRPLWTVATIVLLPACVATAVRHGAPATITLLAFVLLPDVSLIGAFDPDRPGMLRPHRVPFYNVAHSPQLPLTLMALTGTISLVAGQALPAAREVVIAGLAWLLHIAIDRALGYDLRTSDGAVRRSDDTLPVPACSRA